MRVGVGDVELHVHERGSGRPLVALHGGPGLDGSVWFPVLEPLATEAVRRAFVRARGRIPVVGVGGVMTAEDAYRKIRAGSSLVQAYTGFVYGGPRFAPRLLAALAGLLRRDGFATVADAVGADAGS